MANTKNINVAIVGGGIGGLTLAIALHRRNVPVIVYEQAPTFGEIGAGVSFSPNAVNAMKLCHPGIYEVFEQVCTRNLWSSKQNVWFDYLDGYYSCDTAAGGNQEAAFTISNSLGHNGVHRAHFLDGLVKLFPAEIARFGKRLNDVTESSGGGKLVMSFDDGTTAEADAVIGCDGIKSRVRQVIVGADHPSARPSYTYKYAYRGLVPMEKAVEAIGEERAQNACMHVNLQFCRF
jgi:salicylate hydroxylase